MRASARGHQRQIDVHTLQFRIHILQVLKLAKRKTVMQGN